MELYNAALMAMTPGVTTTGSNCENASVSEIAEEGIRGGKFSVIILDIKNRR